MSPRTAAWLAWSLCLLCVALLAASAVFSILNSHTKTMSGTDSWGTANNAFTFPVMVLAFTLVGTLIASRLPANPPIGWICLAIGLTMLLSITAGEYSVYALQIRPGSLPAGEYMAWLENWVWVPSVVLIGNFLVLLFPNGRLLSRRWRVVGWLSVAVLISASFSKAFFPGRLSETPNVTNPFGIESARSALALIADDHPLFRDGMRGLLSTQPDIEVAGEATTGEEAVKLTGELEPDVVLMDIKMPGLGGIEATRRVLAANPRIRVLVVTMFEDDATVFTAMRAGARGYVLKDDDKDDVLGAIRAVGRGGAVFGPSVAARLADFFATDRPAVPREAFPALTDREREMLHLMAKGASNAEIARLLFLSPKTVANYVSNILHKLQVADRKEAASRVREAGLGQDKP